MNKITEFLTEGTMTLKTVRSPINGKLTVKWDTYAGYQILGGGLWQVGGPVENVWRESLKKLPDDFNPNNILILGLGGGSIAKLARRKWKEVSMVGVDIDPVIVELGEKYLGLKRLSVETHIADAYEFIKQMKTKNGMFDLICVDTYVGDNFPEKFTNEDFLENIKIHLSPKGIALFNRLYFGKHTSLAEKFHKRLKKQFSKVEELFLVNEANVIYICS